MFPKIILISPLFKQEFPPICDGNQKPGDFCPPGFCVYRFGLRGQSTVSQPSQCFLELSGSHQKPIRQNTINNPSTGQEKSTQSSQAAIRGGRNQPGTITYTLFWNSPPNVFPACALKRFPERISKPAGQVPSW